MARKKVEDKVEERVEEASQRESKADRALLLCEQIADTLKLIQADLSEVRKRFV